MVRVMVEVAVFRRLAGLAVVFALGLAGCANAPHQQQLQLSYEPVAVVLNKCAAQTPVTCAKNTYNGDDVNDPFEGWNRGVFAVNLALDKVIVRPIAIVYRAVLPEFARGGIANFLHNLRSPVIFANDLLQGDFDRAGNTMARFMINSTIGIGGVLDVAQEFGEPMHDEDFGQTLAVWGMGEGPYVYMLVLGPSNLRDLVGFGVDFALDPLTWVNWGDDDWEYFPYYRYGLTALDIRARNLETLDDLEETSVDFYAALRSLYRQHRDDEIRNNQQDLENLPDIE